MPIATICDRAYNRLIEVVMSLTNNLRNSFASNAMLNLLTQAQAIEQGQTTAAASQASIVEIKRNWNLS